jgi:SAM-dependent methyltransferase
VGVKATASPLAVRWHDIECGSYRADLPLWLRLARGCEGPLLDIGAGTGRVTLELARAGHQVTALDRDAQLLEALRQRARDLPIELACADAREFELGRRFGLILVPMQTVQLLGGSSGRAAFLARAHAHLSPGGLLACAVVGELVAFEPADQGPLPDLCEVDGTLYASCPVAIRREGDRMALERLREMVTPAGRRSVARDLVHLDIVTPVQLIAEAVEFGFHPRRTRRVPATSEHVASQVVMLGA